MKKIVFISGATASGKSSFVHKLIDNYFNKAAIISIDSIQVYRYMDIGSAKPSREEINKYNYKMVDILEPTTNFNIKDYLDIFKNVIENTDNIPIFGVGGTGFYIDAIKYGIFDEENDNKENSEAIRKELYDRIDKYGLESLYSELLNVDKEAAENLDRFNARRVVRALEVYYNTGKKFSELKKQRKPVVDLDYLSYIIDIDRDVLYDNINKRVDIMFEKGLLDEVKRVIELGVDNSYTSMQAIGYKEVYDYLVNNSMTLEETIELIKKRTRNFAKRQLTWFRREEHRRINENDLEKVAEEIKSFYNIN
ncbi:tRNA (adenosine(37)-N6)-dimethylallyltransferase MiaA [uncultured Brachyspira sp.]|uniref:tRNA (adenosine(37)-N6)-dimethylallyltransferase MiaA n=1 Tax=uncultured Brachyspira sp. TaxID=221953 RepID=UPI00263565FC|nr:tRNA (adenosine(37)-N6)-dimethylallyltransferase MiaA [uncultured Brachyspira sp.]